MEFLERDEDNHKPEQEYILPKRKYTKDDNTKFFDDVEDILDAKEARQYKEKAHSAMTKELLIKTAQFDKTWDKWREESQLRNLMKEGLYSPPKSEPETDWSKVAYTGSLQLSNAAIALLCIILGAWPVAFLTIPIFLAYNLYWLLEQEQRGA